MKYGLVKDWDRDTRLRLQNQKQSFKHLRCEAAEFGTSDPERVFHVCDVLWLLWASLCEQPGVAAALHACTEWCCGDPGGVFTAV